MTTSASNKKTILDLPDLCLLTIFDHVPLVEVLTSVSLVCHRWNGLRHSILTRRTRLHLYIGKSEIPDIDQLVVPALTNTEHHRVTTLFRVAKICRLAITIRDGPDGQTDTEHHRETVTSLIELLRLWTSGEGEGDDGKPIHAIDLSYSSVHCSLKFHRSDLCDQLLNAIAGLGRTLRELKIDFWLLQKYVVNDRVPNFPLLAKLTRLETRISDRDELVRFCRWIARNYQANDPNHHRLQIVFPPDMDVRPYEFQLEQIYASGVPLTAFTGSFPLPNGGMFANEQVVHRFCAHFTELTSLRMVIKYGPASALSELTRVLRPLAQLRHLELELNMKLMMATMMLDPGAPSVRPVPHERYQALPSVRHLSLSFYDYYWATIDLWVGQPHSVIWPGVEVVRISHCSIDSTVAPRIARPFSTCDRLRRVELYDRIRAHQDVLTPEQLLLSSAVN